MSEHLSPERLFETLTGRTTATEEKHLQACKACNLEVVQLRNGIEGFSQAVHGVSERHNASSSLLMNRDELRPHSRTRQFTWVLATAAVATAIALPIYEKS